MYIRTATQLSPMADAQATAPAMPAWAQKAAELQSTLRPVGIAAAAYHGYKRNNSIGWAIGWAILGGLSPLIVVPIAAAQGFGKPKKG